jgi:hypothetical protein
VVQEVNLFVKVEKQVEVVEPLEQEKQHPLPQQVLRT